MNVREIPLEKLFIKKNIRTDTDDELGEQMESMAKIGQLQPAGVYPRGGGRYEIVWGHRRYRAAQMNNERTLSCNVLDPETVSEADIPIIKLQENTVRKPLTTEEILAAADAIKAAHPGMTDRQVDVMIGKRPGYLGFRRSIGNARDYLASQGLDKRKLGALSDTDLIDLRARMENREPPSRASMGSFHRDGRVPERGFQIIAAKGPNVVVVCASSSIKGRVVRALKALAKGIA